MTTSRYIDTVPEQAALSADVTAVLRRRLPAWTPDASDPAVYWSDDTAGRVRAWIGQFNGSADANWIMRATGAALRQLANNAGIRTFPDGETDDELRERIFNQFHALAPGTPPHDILLARQADSDVFDAARSFDPANDEVTIYVIDSDGMDLAAAAKTAIQDALNVRTRPAFWLDYMVGDVTVTDYTVDATVIYRTDAESPEPAVRPNLEAVMRRLRRLDTTIYMSALADGMWADNVVDITVTSPNATLMRAPGTVYHGSIGALTFTEEA